MGEKRVYTVSDVARLFGLSLNSVYAGLKTGEIPNFKIGGRFIIPAAKIDRMLQGESLPSVGENEQAKPQNN